MNYIASFEDNNNNKVKFVYGKFKGKIKNKEHFN